MPMKPYVITDIHQKCPAVIQRLDGSKPIFSARLVNAKQASEAQKAGEWRLAVWCEDMALARERARDLNERACIGPRKQPELLRGSKVSMNRRTLKGGKMMPSRIRAYNYNDDFKFKLRHYWLDNHENWLLVGDEPPAERLDLSDEKLNDFDFDGRLLREMAGNNAEFNGCDFSYCDLTKAEFNRAVFRNCNFSKANLTGADLNRATFRDCNFQKTIFDDNIKDAVVYNCDFSDTDFSSNDFSGADFNECNFAGRDFRDADFSSADLYKSNFSDCDLQGALLYNVRALSVDFSRADLSGADLMRANLEDAKLIRANLEGANFKYAKLTRTNFEGANLDGANLEHAEIDGAIGLDDYIEGEED